MKKYLAVIRITLANVLEYRWEFLINQARTVILLLTLYFLWTKVYSQRTILFDFTKSEILSYVFLAAILRQFVLVSATDQIAAELQSWGKFFSYLLKPIGYFRYWFAVDLVYKITSLIFVILIAILLNLSLKIDFLMPSSFWQILLFLGSVLIATSTYFYLAILVSSTGFWTSQIWGLQFLVTLVLEFSAGAFFPIDVLPDGLQSIIKVTPFPYLLYYPVSIFLRRLSFTEASQVIAIGVLWLVIIYLFAKFIWEKGLKVYEAWGA